MEDVGDVGQTAPREDPKPKRIVVKREAEERPREREPAVVDESGSDDEREAMEREKERMKAELAKQAEETRKMQEKLEAAERDEEDEEGEKDPEEEKESAVKKKREKAKKKEEILAIKKNFLEKLISPFTELEELFEIFTKPVPKEVGTLECTIHRNKSGFNYLYPKYTLTLSEGERFLLNAKK